MGVWLFLGFLLLVLIYLIAVYNKLIALRNRFKNGFAQIDVQLQRRHDLIPSLVESAKAYLGHEKETLTQVIEARNQAESARKSARANPDNAGAMTTLGRAEGLLSGSLANLYAVSEQYPELKANETIAQLMEELSSTENRVGFARQAFNDLVMDYNTYREQFPNNFIGGLFGDFKGAQQLDLEDPEARKAVKVSF
ncbi:LemA family protein [Alcanivorax sp. 1008]|jgi:LemA protein|uniref:LemA family protein n=1 Tax=Alcanivorax sp. 1008 TaxID=2816853 RepID=UPI001D44B65A|nr:LemA family protein [Alcanivorax sp. 1008]MCC1496505.1 LemA family protein [Alcanivorax sp. 1008]MEE4251336.1 LemA family protein [Alcanivoracaceae bacterium]